MTKVVADISMSLDGFVTGPDPGPGRGLGRNAEALHTWAVASDDPADATALRTSMERSGAVVMGRRLFDIVDGPQGWNDEMGYGAGLVGTPPFFVVTHSPPESVRLDLRFAFVTEGIEYAIAQARLAAEDKDAVVMGGADVVRQTLELGLADELVVHIAPVLLGAGTPLFPGGTARELRQLTVSASPNATHIAYAVGA